MTGYSAGILSNRVTIQRPPTYQDGKYGRESIAGETFERWAAVDWSRGTKSMREGTLDAYDTIMFRFRYDPLITRDCKIIFGGTTYRIHSFRPDQRAATIQIIAVEENAG